MIEAIILILGLLATIYFFRTQIRNFFRSPPKLSRRHYLLISIFFGLFILNIFYTTPHFPTMRHTIINQCLRYRTEEYSLICTKPFYISWLLQTIFLFIYTFSFGLIIPYTKKNILKMLVIPIIFIFATELLMLVADIPAVTGPINVHLTYSPYTQWLSFLAVFLPISWVSGIIGFITQWFIIWMMKTTVTIQRVLLITFFVITLVSIGYALNQKMYAELYKGNYNDAIKNNQGKEEYIDKLQEEINNLQYR